MNKADRAAPRGVYGEPPAMVQAAVADLGLSYRERQYRNGRWSWSCEGEALPGYTARATAFESAVRMSAAYSIYSAAAHAEWHAVIAGFRQERLRGGGTVLVSRPDRVATSGAMLASVGFAIVPADRALPLLGRTARLAEFGYRARQADNLIRRWSSRRVEPMAPLTTMHRRPLAPQLTRHVSGMTGRVVLHTK